jgi:hypothetical protein
MSLTLIPLMGMLGAALSVAAVNAASNLWYLTEVRRSLGIWPSARKYAALIVPTAAMTLLVLLFREFAATTWPAWAAVVVALAIGYVVFLGASLLLALDADDRVIAHAVRSNVLEMVGVSAKSAGGNK